MEDSNGKGKIFSHSGILAIVAKSVDSETGKAIIDKWMTKGELAW